MHGFVNGDELETRTVIFVVILTAQDGKRKGGYALKAVLLSNLKPFELAEGSSSAVP